MPASPFVFSVVSVFRGTPGVDGSLGEPRLSGVHGALASAVGGVLNQGVAEPILVSLSTQSS